MQVGGKVLATIALPMAQMGKLLGTRRTPIADLAFVDGLVLRSIGELKYPRHMAVDDS